MTQPELNHLLRKLCLSGIAQTIVQRNKEAIDNQLAYSDYLTLLLQDELLRRANNRFIHRVRQAGFKGEKTLEGFDFAFNPKINQALIKDLATCRFIQEKAPVLIVGPCGTGKSHLAQALGHCAIRLGLDVICTNQSALAQTLTAAKATGTYSKVFRRFSQSPLLIIDDFGLKPLLPPEDEYLHAVVAERYENRATLMTSNLDFGEWQDAFPNKLLGAATIDRLKHNAYQLILEGQSYRTLQPNT
jgi:DNA replication protein DnaC